MARGKSTVPRRRPVDLSGSLTSVERDQLVALTNRIIDKMEGQISSLFDSPASTPAPGSVASYDDGDEEWSHISDAIVKQSRASTSSAGQGNKLTKQDSQRARSGTVSSGLSSQPKALSFKAHRLLVHEETEAMTPQLAELKKEALIFFGKWRAATSARIADMEVYEPETFPQGPIRGGRGRGIGGERGGIQTRGGMRGRGSSFRGGRGGGPAPFASASSLPAPTGPPTTPPQLEVDPAFHARYHPTATHLWLIGPEKRRLLLHVVFLLLLSSEDYNAYTRTLLLNLTSSLHLPYRAFQEEEVRIARAFSAAISALPPPLATEHDVNPSSIDDNKLNPNSNSNSKQVALAGDGKCGDGPSAPKLAEPKSGRKRGGAATQDLSTTVSLLTGPLIASGIGSVPGGSGQLYLGKSALIGLLGSVLEASTSMGGFFAAFGGMGPNGPRPMSRSMEQFARDVQDFALMPLGGAHQAASYKDARDVAPHDRRMRFVLAIGGWIDPEDDAEEPEKSVEPWRCLGRQAEAFAVRWDSVTLGNLGSALETATKSRAWEVAKKDMASRSSELEKSVSRHLSRSPVGSLDSGQASSDTSFPNSYLSGHAAVPRVFTPPPFPAPEVAVPPPDLCTYRYFNQQLFLHHHAAQQPAAALLMYCAVLGTLMEVHWPLSLLKISKIIDNPWHMGMVRAEKTGLTLAEALTRHVQGNRPVSLIGYSLGARAIYTCLMILAERRQLNLVDSVVMIGAPAPSESRVWLTLKSVVSGRLINVYSETDYLLAFLYRTSNVQFGLAGVQAVHAEGIENHNVGDILAVGGHLRYRHMVGSILRDVGWDDLDMTRVERDIEALAVFDGRFAPKPQAPRYAAPAHWPTHGPHGPTHAPSGREMTMTCADAAQKKRRRRGRRGQGKSIIQN